MALINNRQGHPSTRRARLIRQIAFEIPNIRINLQTISRMPQSGGIKVEDLIFEKGEIALLTINRPNALNALNRQVVENLAIVLRELRNDRTARVLILTGAGDRAFVAGADIASMAKMMAVEGLEFSQLG